MHDCNDYIAEGLTCRHGSSALHYGVCWESQERTGNVNIKQTEPVPASLSYKLVG